MCGGRGGREGGEEKVGVEGGGEGGGEEKVGVEGEGGLLAMDNAFIQCYKYT